MREEEEEEEEGTEDAYKSTYVGQKCFQGDLNKTCYKVGLDMPIDDAERQRNDGTTLESPFVSCLNPSGTHRVVYLQTSWDIKAEMLKEQFQQWQQHSYS